MKKKLFLSIFIIIQTFFTVYSKVDFTSDGVIFSLKDKNYKSVSIAGSFNNWSSTENILQKNNDMWTTSVKIGFGKYQYKFVIDNGDWIIDPENESIIKDGNFDNSYFEYNSKSITAELEKSNIDKSIKDIPIEEKLDVTYFSFIDKEAKSISVTGEFVKWKTDVFNLTDHDGDGKWEGSYYIEPGKYTYFFIVNQSKWYSDPQALEFEEDGFGGKNSVLIVR
ncbi:MAG: hypothetical protein M0R46_02255 [Candidatus Muirbacterium halophilum]|nr:hypothetical protein [Candidatus Muirbacterium halophilum]MCK9474712.1 hypothetical protein [Candidatus Muirbacterium halophilum]